MLVYWLLFAFFAVGALATQPQSTEGRRATYPLLAVGSLIIALLVGVRYEVGADWRTYGFMFEYARHTDMAGALRIGDPGYQLLNYFVQQLDYEIWLVNLVCGLLFAWGFYRFVTAQPDPWLAALVGVPYLVVVVAMGYSRQAVAIGLLMAGLASLQRGGSLVRFAVYVAAAALFHKTAVVAFPLVVISGGRNRFLNMLFGAATFVLLYDFFLGDSVEQFVSRYVETEYSSQGAAIRVAMNLVPAVLFLLAYRRFQLTERDYYILRNFSLAALGFLVLLIVVPSSTAVDRMALYVMPLQLAVLSRVPGSLMSVGTGKLAVVGYCLLIQFVWLNYAQHAQYWLPYQFYPM